MKRVVADEFVVRAIDSEDRMLFSVTSGIGFYVIEKKLFRKEQRRLVAFFPGTDWIISEAE